MTPAVGDASAQRVEPPRPVGVLKAPEYPTSLLDKKAGDAVVGVRLTIDTAGRVVRVTSSFATFSAPNPFAEDFRAAIEEAVRHWQFQPAEIRHLETVKDPLGDYQRLARRETIEWLLEVQFKFSAAGATGSAAQGR